MRIGVIVRPRQGLSELETVRSWVDRLRDRGHDVWPRLTFEAGDGSREAAALAAAGADLVVAVGGDGTVNEVVNGVLSTASDWRGRLGVVPEGTGNDFAAGLGIPLDADEAWQVAVDGEPSPLDVGRINDRYFVNVSVGGFGVSAAGQAPEEVKRLLGPWTYVVAGARQLTELEPHRARFLVAADVVHDGEILMFAVGNGKQTGGGNMVTPRAQLDDGLLDVLIVPAMTRVEFLSLLPELRTGDHLDDPRVVYFHASDLVVDSEAPLAVNADGEAIAGERFHYTVASRKLAVMRPAAAAESG